MGSGCVYISLRRFRVVKSLGVTRRAQVPKRVLEGTLPGQLKYIALCVCHYRDSLITAFMIAKVC